MRSSVSVAATTPYEVLVQPALDLASAISPGGAGETAILLTDSTVGPLHAPAVAAALQRAGWDVLDTVTVPAGEASKSLSI